MARPPRTEDQLRRKAETDYAEYVQHFSQRVVLRYAREFSGNLSASLLGVVLHKALVGSTLDLKQLVNEFADRVGLLTEGGKRQYGEKRLRAAQAQAKQVYDTHLLVKRTLSALRSPNRAGALRAAGYATAQIEDCLSGPSWAPSVDNAIAMVAARKNQSWDIVRRYYTAWPRFIRTMEALARPEHARVFVQLCKRAYQRSAQGQARLRFLKEQRRKRPRFQPTTEDALRALALRQRSRKPDS